MKIDINEYENFLKNGENKITVYSYEENDYFRSRGVDNIIQITKKDQIQPQFLELL